MKATTRTPLPGIVLDCSHLSALDLDRRILAYAQAQGYRYIGAWPDGTPISEDDPECVEIWREEAEEAVDWLNDRVAQGSHLFIVEDNSLYYWHEGDSLA